MIAERVNRSLLQLSHAAEMCADATEEVDVSPWLKKTSVNAMSLLLALGGVEPDQTGHWSPGRSECPSDARHGSDRERVVAAHDERKMPFRDNRLDSFAQ